MGTKHSTPAKTPAASAASETHATTDKVTTLDQVKALIATGNIYKKIADEMLDNRESPEERAELLLLQKEEYLKAAAKFANAAITYAKISPAPPIDLGSVAILKAADMLLKAEKYDEAKKVLSSVSSSYSELKNFFLGQFSIHTGSFEEAIDYFRLALDTESADSFDFKEYTKASVNCKYGYAILKFCQNTKVKNDFSHEYREADNAFSKAATADPTYAEVFLNWGSLLKLEGKATTEVLEKYEEAIKQNPKYIEAYIAKGMLLLADNDKANDLDGLKSLRIAQQLIQKFGFEGDLNDLGITNPDEVFHRLDSGLLETLEHVQTLDIDESAKAKLISDTVSSVKDSLTKAPEEHDASASSASASSSIKDLHKQAKAMISSSTPELSDSSVLKAYLHYKSANSNAATLDEDLQEIETNQALSDYYHNFKFAFNSAFDAIFVQASGRIASAASSAGGVNLTDLTSLIPVPFVKEAVSLLMIGVNQVLKVHEAGQIGNLAKMACGISEMEGVINELALQVTTAKKADILKATPATPNWFDAASAKLTKFWTPVSKDSPQSKMGVADASKLLAECLLGKVGTFLSHDKLLKALSDIALESPAIATSKVSSALAFIDSAAIAVKKLFPGTVADTVAGYIALGSEQLEKIVDFVHKEGGVVKAATDVAVSLLPTAEAAVEAALPAPVAKVLNDAEIVVGVLATPHDTAVSGAHTDVVEGHG